jgi:hypothetical protein
MENEIILEKYELVPAVQKLLSEKARFATATCLDLGDQYEILYHFEPQESVVPVKTLRVRIPKGEILPSISGIYACAVMAENEMIDDFNIQINGLVMDFHRKLMLSKESKVFPLNKTPTLPKEINK